MCQTCLESQFLNLNFMKGFVMSGLRTFGGAIGGYIGSEVGDRVEDYIRGVDREPQTREPQAPREPIRDFYDYGYSFGHAW
ncbi:pantothenate kinase [Helicobacter pylori]|nr:pantothenate kinase [Helicobacter pylori]